MKTSIKRTYGQNATALAFPLGGIGTGNISLNVRGNLCDWEIFNHPGKGILNPNSFFSIWVRQGRKRPVCKVLEGLAQPPYTHSHGFQPYSAAGLPHIQHTQFFGEYPFAKIVFNDPDIPLAISLEAFTPLIPLQSEESGIPCAILNYHVTNTSTDPVSISLVGSLMNPVGEIKINSFGAILPDDIGQTKNDFFDTKTMRGIYFTSERYKPGELKYGNLCLATTHPNVTYKRAWLRAGWFDYLREFWNDLKSDGLLHDLGYDTPSPIGINDTASLGVTDELQPGQSGLYRFVISWYFPFRPKSWNPCCNDKIIRNHYAVKFTSSLDAAQYVVDHLASLEQKTRKFHRTLFQSTLPESVKDALSANIVPLRSTTCFWHEDGSFYGYEGCGDNRGCCEGTCTHVWSYAHTLAYLFPDLERNMRLNEFTKETESNGFMYFRGYQQFGEHFIWDWGDQKPEAAIDGQMGSILRVLREWRLSGDVQWLNEVWDGVVRAIHFVLNHWDTDGDGIPDGRQHNTYDIEFYGPNPLGTIYYLAALRAVEELAKVMGAHEVSEKCRDWFLSASPRADSLLWNGEYYIQKLDDINKYKYQSGTGCLSDQLLGQLHARILDLGYVLPQEHVKAAIRAIFRHNFKKDFRLHQNCQRTYILNDESGLILCSWPHGGEPDQPFVYSDEVWTGIEYEIASLLIYEGMVEEGIGMVKAIRKRHDGIRRNPWNEVECGNHYARSMASWGILLGLSGFQYDAHSHAISFAPAIRETNFHCLFTTGSGWGGYFQKIDKEKMELTLEVEHGSLTIRNLKMPTPKAFSKIEVRIGPNPVKVVWDKQYATPTIRFIPDALVEEGECLSIRLS